MKLTEARLKRMVAEQTFANLFENDRFEEAAKFYIKNKDFLDEGIFDKFVPASMRGDRIWSDIEKQLEMDELPGEVADLKKQVAALTAALAKSQSSGNKAKQDHVKALKQVAPNADPTAIEAAATAFDVIDNNPVALKQAQAAVGAETTSPIDGDVTSPEEAKPESPAKTVKDLTKLVVSGPERKMLLRGLLQLLTNDSVERALAVMKPQRARQAVLSFLKQVVDMEPKAYKKFKAGMQKPIFRDLVASDKAYAPGSRDKQMRRQAMGDAAGKKVSAEMGKLGLSEGVDKELAEKIAILEALDLYFERKSSNAK